ncbi:MAG TPA: HK97 family phage prohead protease [Edaphobacter sp.]|nr:HK97 family phage prohead protease [Edaphobacter sp.]
MLTRDFNLKVKGFDQTGSFTGYASTYNGVDLHGDTILAGAFKQAIASQGNGFPLLWSHQPSEPLGLAKISDSAAGLVVDGSMVMVDPAAQRAYAHLKAGSIKGLSIGYTLPSESSGKTTYNADGTRTIREIKLYEVSLVAIPADPRAIVTSVKSLSQVESLLRGVRPGDLDAVLMEQLRGIDAELKRLLIADDDSEGRVQVEQAAEELALLKSFAAELEGITA